LMEIAWKDKIEIRKFVRFKLLLQL
jgi:hypothetical protein